MHQPEAVKMLGSYEGFARVGGQYSNRGLLRGVERVSFRLSLVF